MADPRLTLDSGPLSSATAALERTARTYDQIARSHERLAKMADREEVRGRQRTQRAQAISGPFSRLERLRSLTASSPMEQADLAVRIGQAERAVARTRRTGFAGRLATAISSTRFGAGPVSPLVGRSLDVIAPGLGTAIGPLALAATAAVVALHVLEQTVRASAASLTEFRAAATETGGTAGQTAGLAAMGIQPGQQAGAAAALRGRLGTDPFAMMAGGFRMDPRFGGNQNTAADLQNQLEILHGMGQGEAQLLRARRLGLEAMLATVNVSEDVWRSEQRLAEGRAALAPSAQAAADLTARYRILGEQTELLRDRIGAHLLPAANAFLGWLNSVAEWIENHVPGARGAVDKAKADADKHRNSLDNNTDAINNLRSTMENNRTMTGGGPMGQGIPTQLRGDELMRALRAGAYRMGAWK